MEIQYMKIISELQMLQHKHKVTAKCVWVFSDIVYSCGFKKVPCWVCSNFPKGC